MGGGLVPCLSAFLFLLFSDDTSFVGVLAQLALRVLALFLLRRVTVLSSCSHMLPVDAPIRAAGCGYYGLQYTVPGECVCLGLLGGGVLSTAVLGSRR